MLKTIFTLLIISIITATFGQNKYATESKKAIKYYEEAVMAFKQRKINNVEGLINLAIKKDSNFIDAYLLRSELWRIEMQTQKQINDLKKAINLQFDYHPYAYLNLGMAQLKIGLYSSAKSSFEAFLNIKNVREKSLQKAQLQIEKCNYAIQLVNNPVPFKPISLGDSINTKNDQYWPSLSLDGRYLYYSVLLVDSTQKTITGHYAHQEDFYVSRHNNGKWSKGLAIGPPLNTPGNEGALKISTDGNTIVYTACNREDGHGMCDIYFAYQTISGWTRATNIRTPVNTKYSEKQPCLSADGKTLYFSSNRPGGLGGMDIWYSEIDEQGYWGEPKNMGSKINTTGDEESPFMHPDNETFYFSSDGHKGLGMKDIYISKKNDSLDWTPIKNLGYPINTFNDEIGLFVDHTGERAYYSTNFNDSSRNIYEFIMPVESRPKAVSYLSGKVSDIETGASLKAKIVLLEAISGDTVMETISDEQNGHFFICLPEGKKYALNASCENYLFKSLHFDLYELHTFDEPYEQNIELSPIKINEAIVLRNIFFKSSSYELLPESNAELIKIQQFINKNPEWHFEIGGHTDNTGTSAYNQELSEKRAKTVFDYLVSKNINHQSISYKGYGEQMPVGENDTEEEKAKNRRTEIKIIRKIE